MCIKALDFIVNRGAPELSNLCLDIPGWDRFEYTDLDIRYSIRIIFVISGHL